MRSDAKSRSLRHRPTRSVAALIVAVLLLALGVALAWVGIARLINGRWPSFLAGPRDWVGTLTWNGPALLAISIAAVVLGLVLVLAALIPGPPSGFPVRGPRDDDHTKYETVITRQGVARLSKAQADRLDGVDSSAAKVAAKRVEVQVKTPLRIPGNLRDRVSAAVAERLEGAGIDPSPKVSAHVQSRDS